MRTAKTGRMLKLIFAGRTCHFVGFVMRWLILSVAMTTAEYWPKRVDFYDYLIPT